MEFRRLAKVIKPHPCNNMASNEGYFVPIFRVL